MASFNEIAYNILNIYRAGGTGNDEVIQPSQIIFMVNYYRSILIKKELDKKKQLDKNLTQDLGCVPVIKVDRAECCHIKSDCVVYRTEKPLPKLAIGNEEMFVYVGGADKHTPFNLINKPYANWVKHSKYFNKGIFVYYMNGHLYIEGYPHDLAFINVIGIFDNPVEAQEYVECHNTDCLKGYDAEYPIPAYMLKSATELIMRTELSFMVKREVDVTNNFKPLQANENL
jgi:hypothetical protein